jgi:hypothetical protein
VRDERPPKVDWLAAGADELELCIPCAHVRSNERRGKSFPCSGEHHVGDARADREASGGSRRGGVHDV